MASEGFKMWDVEDERFWWLALSRVPGVGPVTYLRLIKIFGHPRAVFQAPKGELVSLGKIGSSVAEAIGGFRGKEEILRELDRMDKLGIRMVVQGRPGYPKLLAAIPDPPPVLFVRGEILPQDDVAVAIVGSRAASQQGLRFTHRLARELAAAGVTIVSGMARGIDSEAHRGALAAGGRTLAVLGSGLNVIYPSENKELFFKIMGQGAVVSEYGLDVKPDAVHFPARNRIISGLSLGVTIVEAAPQSGSLITARLALEQGREVFAVPGHADSMRSKGTNRLIRQGAKLVECAQDILEDLAPMVGRLELGEKLETEAKKAHLTQEEARILSLLDEEEMQIDELVEKGGMSPAQTASVLLQLELKGLVIQLSGKRFQRCDG